MPAERCVGVYGKCSHRHGGRAVEKLRVRNCAQRKWDCRLRIDDGCANKYAQAQCDYRCYLEFSDFHVSSLMLVAFSGWSSSAVYLVSCQPPPPARFSTGCTVPVRLRIAPVAQRALECVRPSAPLVKLVAVALVQIHRAILRTFSNAAISLSITKAGKELTN